MQNPKRGLHLHESPIWRADRELRRRICSQYDNALPIWGIQRESELDEFLSYIDTPPHLTDTLQAVIDRDKSELAGDFCRGCGYCLPCPAQIDIPSCARMSLLLRRSPAEGHLSPAGQEKMARIDQCIHCNHCADHCPYGLNTPELLRRNYEDYKTFCSNGSATGI